MEGTLAEETVAVVQGSLVERSANEKNGSSKNS